MGDSPEGTADKIRNLAQAHACIRCIQRIGGRGLSTAVIEGKLSSSAPYLAVIDADLQHDGAALARMLCAIKAQDLDVVIRIGAFLPQLVVPAELSDPMSGFFLISWLAFERADRRLSGQGFKILVDLFASPPVPYRFAEVTYEFRQRLHGQSKLDALSSGNTSCCCSTSGLVVLSRLASFRLQPAAFPALRSTFLLFIANRGLRISYCTDVGTVAAMTINFALNNFLTHRDCRLSGLQFFTDLESFYGV